MLLLFTISDLTGLQARHAGICAVCSDVQVVYIVRLWFVGTEMSFQFCDDAFGDIFTTFLTALFSTDTLVKQTQPRIIEAFAPPPLPS